MGPTLRYIGLAVLAGAAWVLVAEEAGWIPAHVSEVWLKPVLLAAMRGASPRTQFIPVPQFNPTVVNTHLAKYRRYVPRLRRKMAGTVVAKWMANLHGFNEENAWRYLALLEDLTKPRSSNSL